MGNNLYYLEENENIKHKIKYGKKNRKRLEGNTAKCRQG